MHKYCRAEEHIPSLSSTGWITGGWYVRDDVMRQNPIFSVPPAVLQFERTIRNRTDTEETAFFSPTGSIVLRLQGISTGDGFFTVIPAELLARLGGCILTHNHPSGCSFTCSDLREAAFFSLAEIRVVTQTVVYSMKPGPHGWPAAEIIADRWRMIAHDPVFRTDVEALCTACGNHAADRALCCRRIRVNLLCERLASALHLIYLRGGLDTCLGDDRGRI